MRECARFQAQKIPLLPPGHHDGRTSARSTHLRRALIHFSFASLLRHTLHHTNHPSTALSLSSCSSTKCPSLSTPGHGLCSIPSIIRRAEGDNATRSRHSLSLSSRAHSTHTQRVATLKSPLLLLSCAVSFLLPPSHSLLASSLIAKCVPSLSITLTHTRWFNTHTHTHTHTPRKISASRRATLPWEEHSLKDKKTRPRSPSSPFLRHRISLLFTRCSAARAPPSSPRGCHSPPTSPQSGSPTTHSSHSAS